MFQNSRIESITMTEKTDDLKKKISNSKFFIVLATRGYLKDLKSEDKDIMTQIDMAREMNKPFYIIKDRRLSQKETEEIDKYFSGDRIIKETKADIGSESSARNVASEIKQMMICMFPENKGIRLVTQDTIDKD